MSNPTSSDFPVLPVALQEWLSRRFPNQQVSVAPQRGGMINTAARLTMNRGSVLFAKWKENAPRGFFAAEAQGLECLRATGIVRVPGVHTVEEPDPSSRTPFIVMEYIPVTPPSDPYKFARRLGEQLAQLHQEAVSPDGRFGLNSDNFIGVLPQINSWQSRWSDFYRECRLLPQIALALQNNRLPTYREDMLMDVIDRLDTLLATCSEPACLLHGDLWSGNFLSDGEEPVLVDPAVYYGPREMEIAYIDLFSGFPPGFLAAYRAVYPLDAGYTRRRALHQLYPLLNHLNHFGETYGTDVDSACREIIRTL